MEQTKPISLPIVVNEYAPDITAMEWMHYTCHPEYKFRNCVLSALERLVEENT